MKANRRMRTGFNLLPAILLLFASLAGAQEMTERHIPVGAYPSLASKYVTAGTIVAVDDETMTLTLKDSGSERSFRVTENTKIWLDRSGLGQTTLDGNFSDLATGLKAEVRSLGPERSDVAYWVKQQMAAP